MQDERASRKLAGIPHHEPVDGYGCVEETGKHPGGLGEHLPNIREILPRLSSEFRVKKHGR